MKIINNSKIIFLFLASFIFLNACNPNISETTIYTSDFEEVKNGEVIDVPMKLSFQMIGDDADNSLEKSKNIAKYQRFTRLNGTKPRKFWKNGINR